MVDREAAVSSVIGVILLLAIVVILAALVASFAGGAADTKEPPPSVDFAVYPGGGEEKFTLVFEHRGGDLVQIRDLKVNTWVHLKGGDLRPASHEQEELVRLFSADVWRAGSGVNVGDLRDTAGFLDLTVDELKECIGRSAVVEVAIYHLPSGALLHKGSTLLKER